MKKIIFSSFLMSVFLYGVLVGRYHVFPYQILKDAKSRMAAVAAPVGVDSDHNDKPRIPRRIDIYTELSGKQEIPCGSIDMTNTMVALAFGQSNSANYGETRYAAHRSVYNFHEGKCYKAADPLLGASGKHGSVWTRLGDLLVEEGLYSNVIIISIGVGGTPVSRWKTDGDLFQRIVSAKKDLDRQNMQLTHLLWHQGEADGKRGTGKADYKSMVVDMLDGIRGLGIDAPLYLAVATRCKSPVAVDIHDAQLELVEARGDILMGANTDTLSDMDDRIDFCHFSDRGLLKHASLWLQSIRNADTGKPLALPGYN